MSEREEKLEALVRRYRAALTRININYRSGSGLPLHLQAYCMRSEAKAALDESIEASWCAELAQIQDQHAKKG